MHLLPFQRAADALRPTQDISTAASGMYSRTFFCLMASWKRGWNFASRGAGSCSTRC